MVPKRKNAYQSIKQALENGKITRYYHSVDKYNRKRAHFLIKYYKPIVIGAPWSITAEWYECSEKYWQSTVCWRVLGKI